MVSNAGGVNPEGCAAALQEAARKADVDLSVAVVTGDDLMDQVLLSMSAIGTLPVSYS